MKMKKKKDDWERAYREWYEKDWNQCQTCGSTLKGKILREHLKEWVIVVKNTIKDLKKKKKDYNPDVELLKFLQDKLKKIGYTRRWDDGRRHKENILNGYEEG